VEVRYKLRLKNACHAATTPIKTDPTPSQGALITSQQSIKIYKQRTKQFFHFRFTPFLSTFQEICSKGKIDFSCNRNITIFVKNIRTKISQYGYELNNLVDGK
jgi:hypothetical protein